MKTDDKEKLLRMLVTVGGLILLVGIANHFRTKSQTTLADYAAQNPEAAYGSSTDAGKGGSEAREGQFDEIAEGFRDLYEFSRESTLKGSEAVPAPDDEMIAKALSPQAQFYSAELTEDQIRYITGISYPLDDTNAEIRYEDLRYLHVLHYNFDGDVCEGELICNRSIAEDLLSIFYELYRNEYRIEKIRLIDEYKADDDASCLDNNTSCFNYRVVKGSDRLSRHALGLAVDLNPFYNPYITYNADGTQNITPEGSEEYADRSRSFPYKIDENDLAYKLFTEHGFTWGGNWNTSKDYQHFQKAESF